MENKSIFTELEEFQKELESIKPPKLEEELRGVRFGIYNKDAPAPKNYKVEITASVTISVRVPSGTSYGSMVETARIALQNARKGVYDKHFPRIDCTISDYKIISVEP